MTTQILPGKKEITSSLNLALSCLTTDQLYSSIKALNGNFYVLPDKSPVYEISGVTKKNNTFLVHFLDTAIGIDKVQLTVDQLDQRMVADIKNAIDKIS